jgi:hypothetical protein
MTNDALHEFSPIVMEPFNHWIWDNNLIDREGFGYWLKAFEQWLKSSIAETEPPDPDNDH